MPEKTALAIIADEDIVLGFKALGFKVHAVKDLQGSGVALDEAVQAGCAICLVQDNIYRHLESQINRFKQMAWPIFVPFARDAGMDCLGQIVKDIRLKATGTN
jgi:vacuolar-type H+-ATPase subunit F/Vma7